MPGKDKGKTRSDYYGDDTSRQTVAQLGKVPEDGRTIFTTRPETSYQAITKIGEIPEDGRPTVVACHSYH